MTPDLDDDQRVRIALLLAIQPVTADDGLLAAVRDRIRRRRRTRRLTLAATLAVLAVPLAMVTVGGRGPAPRLSAADQALLDRPTGGDLAADRGYLSRVAGAAPTMGFTAGAAVAGTGGRHAESGPHVVWAGRTPVGPAAISVRPVSVGGAATLEVSYFAADPAGRPELVASGPLWTGAASLGGALIGPSYTVLLVLDQGWTVEYRDGGGGGGALRFVGGAAVLTLPAGTDPRLVSLHRPGAPPQAQPRLGNRPVGVGPLDGRLLEFGRTEG
jgi:hypothetical protein